jgi:succinoglycan biosynthesis transport protein ExoP
MAKSYASPKIRQIVTEAVFRRRRIFVLTLLLVLGAVALVTVLMPKRYSAEAKLMVQNLRTSAPLTTNPADRMVQANDVSQTEVNSEVDLLESAGTARRALTAKAGQAESEAEEKQVDDLQHRLKVEAVHQTNLINVKLLGASPEEARAQLQKVIDAYFEERAGAARSSGAAEFFDRQVQDKGRELQETQEALTNFELEHHLANLDDQKKLQVTRIAALQEQLGDATAALARQRSREAAQKQYLSSIPARSQTVERTITNQYSQERLNTALVELQNRRTELVRLYPATDRQVIEINEKIATTQRAIAAAGEHPAAEASSDVNPVWQQLRQQVANSSGEVSGLSAQRAQVQEELSEAQVRLKELEESTGPNAELQRKLAQTQADYTLYSQKRDEARIAGELDKEKMFDVSLVQAPVASPRAVRPKPVLYLAAGLVFALLLGTLLALYADTSAEQVFTPSQLDALTGSRTLAVLADERDGNQDLGGPQVELRRLLVAMRKALATRDEDELVGAVTGHEAAMAEEPGRPAGYCVGFTSALPGEGTSYLVSNLATAAAKQAGNRVAVLDVETLLRKFEAEEDVSFGMKFNTAKEYWTLALEGEGAAAGVRTRGAQGQFAARLKGILIEGRREFDLLFLDCPSFRASTLANELDQCVDGYVAVVSAGMARRQNVEQMEAALRQSRAPLLGYVLNRRRYPVPQWLHRMMW